VLGGGIDVASFHDQFYWRVIQTDYLITQPDTTHRMTLGLPLELSSVSELQGCGVNG
jgi:hypothetical protein